MNYLLAAAMGYLLGCFNLAYFIGKLKNKDLRKGGSGNLGASNATVLLGWYVGVAVAVHDIAKSCIAVLLAKWLFPELPYAGVAAGIAAVVGHIFPFYLNFKGGKGFASYFGVALALNWKFALFVAVMNVVVTLVSDYIFLATLFTATAVPVYLAVTTGDPMLVAILCVGTVLIYLRHVENFRRLARREEIGLRSTMRGEHRKQ